MTTPCPSPSKANLQGLLVRGYTHPYSCHLLYQFGAATAAPPFFKALCQRGIQNAESWAQKPATIINLGITAPGIARLGVLDAADLKSFPPEFQQGPWSPQSQSSLGDIGTSAPAKWWYNNFRNQDLHCIVHTYGLTAADLAEVVGYVSQAASSAGFTELFAAQDKQTRLSQYQLPDDEIHFGYRDGISEPALTWCQDPNSADEGDLNNFIIGYPDCSLVAPGPTGGKAGAFAKDGGYNAFRLLYQDVAAFNQLIATQGEAVAPRIARSPADAAEWVAAKLIGRWRNGSPLMLSPDAPSPSTQDGEDFLYYSPPPSNPADAGNVSKCPFSAHTRVANPRDEELMPGEGPVVPGQGIKAVRIARRGMPYGPPLTAATDDGVDRGLIGLFLCGSLAGQFEKISSWFNINNFSPVFSGIPSYPQDAVLGNRSTNRGLTNTQFSIPLPAESGPCPAFNFKLPDLLITRGSAYCLLPGINTIRQLAGLPPLLLAASPATTFGFPRKARPPKAL
jgi:deferrochelatase/peroxidase EfeB